MLTMSQYNLQSALSKTLYIQSCSFTRKICYISRIVLHYYEGHRFVPSLTNGINNARNTPIVNSTPLYWVGFQGLMASTSGLVTHQVQHTTVPTVACQYEVVSDFLILSMVSDGSQGQLLSWWGIRCEVINATSMLLFFFSSINQHGIHVKGWRPSIQLL